MQIYSWVDIKINDQHLINFVHSFLLLCLFSIDHHHHFFLKYFSVICCYFLNSYQIIVDFISLSFPIVYFIVSLHFYFQQNIILNSSVFFYILFCVTLDKLTHFPQ